MEVDVEAYEEPDAVEFIDEAMGEGDYSGYTVVSMSVTNIHEV